MHHPVPHPLTDHAHSPAERLAIAGPLVDEVERASAEAVREIHNALAGILGRTRRRMRQPSTLAQAIDDGQHADVQTIDRACREVESLTQRLHAQVVQPTLTRHDK